MNRPSQHAPGRSLPRSRAISARHIAIVLAILASVAGLAIVFGGSRPAVPTGDVVVVRGAIQAGAFSPRADVPAAPSAPAEVRDRANAPTRAPDPAALGRELTTLFPTLDNVRLACTDICTVTATAYEARDRGVEASRLPYLGRLEDHLRQRGFTPIDGLMIEEAGGGESTLRLRFRGYRDKVFLEPDRRDATAEVQPRVG